jgi:DNA-binding NarL/FixJ family response regulator
VRNHVSAIFAKLEVSDRTQAAVIAIQHGLGEAAM